MCVFLCDCSEAIMYTAASICYSMISYKTQFERYLLEIYLSLDILCLKLRPKNGRDLHRSLLCNGQNYTANMNNFRTSTHPQYFDSFIVFYYYEVQLLLHISFLPHTVC